MELSTRAPTGAGAGAPRPEQDLRPVADAAALARDPRGAAQASAVLPVLAPASLSQTAAVSRSLIDPAYGPAPVERVLKPWGVQMPPAAAEDRSAPQQQRRAAADPEG